MKNITQAELARKLARIAELEKKVAALGEMNRQKYVRLVRGSGPHYLRILRQESSGKIVDNVGFTGTQSGMTAYQKVGVLKLLHGYFQEQPEPRFHHGDCIGADEEAAELARKVGFYIVGWPCTITAKRAHFPSDASHIPSEPLVRNRAIVLISGVLIATPRTMAEELRSGTWATIRFARKMHRKIEIVWPDCPTSQPQ